jgi:membrane protein DedA with SNARE-associated domain
MSVFHVPTGAGYASVALLVGSESAGLPVPGETSLVAAAVLASQGRLSLPAVVGVAAAAAIAGDNLGYLLGRRGGRWLLTRPGRWERRRQQLLPRGEAFFERHGPKAVFFGRWIPWLRITAAWLAGAARMRWPRFFVWNATGGLTWATSVGIAAYVLGKSATTVLGAAAAVVITLLVLAALVVTALRGRHSAPERVAAAAPAFRRPPRSPGAPRERAAPGLRGADARRRRRGGPGRGRRNNRPDSWR